MSGVFVFSLIFVFVLGTVREMRSEKRELHDTLLFHLQVLFVLCGRYGAFVAPSS